MLTKINFNSEILKEGRLKQNKTLDELPNAIELGIEITIQENQ